MYHVSDKLNEIEHDSFTSWESAVQMQTLRLINFGELAVEFAGRGQKQNDRVKRNTSYLVVHRLGQPQIRTPTTQGEKSSLYGVDK